MSSKISIRLQRWIPFIIIAIGAIFRIRQLLLNRSLWLDEALLANNIVTHSLKFLLTQPLDNQQAAPWGFLFSLKLFGKIFGYHDYVFRLVPFIASLLFLLVCERLSRSLKKTLARYGFLALISFSPILIYYSSEVKQYIFDIFFATFLLWIAMNYQKWKFGYLILGISGIVSILFSQPSVFVLAAIGIYEVLVHWVQKQSITVFRLISIGLVWLFVFAGMYYLSTRFATADRLLVNYWGNAFAPLPINNVGKNWYLDSVLALVFNIYAGITPLAASLYPQMYSFQHVLITFGTIAGLLLLYKNNPQFFWISALDIGINLAVSGFHLYPFRSRPIIYLIPITIFWLCNLVDWSIATSRLWINGLGLAIITLAIIVCSQKSIPNFFTPKPWSDIKSCLSYISQHKQPNDQLAISEWSLPAFEFYQSKYDLGGILFTENISKAFETQSFTNTLCQNKHFGKTWVLFSHRFSQSKDMVFELSQQAPLIKVFETEGSGVYYFDFNSQNICP